MKKIQSVWQDLRVMDDLAGRDSVIHRVHPVVKLLVTLGYIGVVVSFPKYEVIRLLPLVCYPMVLFILAELPVNYFLRQILLAIPFVFFVAVFNPILDQGVWLTIGSVKITAGWVSGMAILVKFCLTVLAVLQLVATTGLNELGAALLKCKMPRIFVTQLLLLYRYLAVLIEETGNLLQAHSLRSVENEGVSFRVWGSLVGQLLLRTIDRAWRIYQAMLCRGFIGELHFIRRYQWSVIDLSYLLGWLAFLFIVRWVDLPGILGSLMTGVGR